MERAELSNRNRQAIWVGQFFDSVLVHYFLGLVGGIHLNNRETRYFLFSHYHFPGLKIFYLIQHFFGYDCHCLLLSPVFFFLVPRCV